MNKDEILMENLQKEVLAMGVPQEIFSIGPQKGGKNEVWFYIVQKKFFWEVGTVERASVYDVKTFQNFEDAKKYFMEPLLDYLEEQKEKLMA